MKVLFGLLILAVNMGCGVKGDPIPPDKPPILGRGEPNFRRATKEFKLPDIPLDEDEESEKK